MSAYAVYSAYLSEIRAAVEFYQVSAQLRPRLNGYILWDAADISARQMIQRFLQGRPRESMVYQSALVSLHSGFEQFVIDLIDDAAEVMSSRELEWGEFEKKFPGAVKQSRHAAGHALVSVFEPRSYWKIDYDELIAKLATTKVGSDGVSIYGRSFAVRKGSLSCEELERLLGRLSLQLPWGDISKDSKLQHALGTSSKAETEVALKSKLARLLELRNHLAHSQGAEEITYEQVIGFVSVYERFCFLLSDSVLNYARNC